MTRRWKSIHITLSSLNFDTVRFWAPFACFVICRYSGVGRLERLHQKRVFGPFSRHGNLRFILRPYLERMKEQTS
jgi:hypothetical protein